MSRLAALAGASVFAMTVASAASAGTVTADDVSFSDSFSKVSITGAAAGDPSVLVTFKDVRAGRFKITTDLGDNIFAWCVDLYETINLGGTDRVYKTGTLAGDLTNPPAPLTAAQMERVGGLAQAGDDALQSDPGNGDLSAAYQAAIWQTIYGGSYDGNATFDGLFATIVAGTYSNTSGTLYQEFNKDGTIRSQQLYGDDPDPVPPPPPPVIPGPGALGLFGFALAGLVLARRGKAA
jgi:hypothetical protein